MWPGTFVSDAVLKDSIRQLREALGDDAGVAAIHRDGASARLPLHRPDLGRRRGRAARPLTRPRSSGHDVAAAPASVLGRGRELASMRRWLERALRGERQVVFVTGEPGIGKTTLVNALLDQAASSRDLDRARPVPRTVRRRRSLPAGARRLLAARPGAGRRTRHRAAAPARAGVAARAALAHSARPSARRCSSRSSGATRERCCARWPTPIEAMTAEAPLILVLEDLHWSDYSTLDLIAYLARRRDPARLMVIGTYRPVDVILGEHPLKGVKRELQAHGLCHELPLEYLTEEAVAQYLAVKLPRPPVSTAAGAADSPPHRRQPAVHGQPRRLPDRRAGHRRASDGRLAAARRTCRDIESGVPENIRQLIEKQIERLSADERRVLEGASVVGMECSSVAIGAGLDRADRMGRGALRSARAAASVSVAGAARRIAGRHDHAALQVQPRPLSRSAVPPAAADAARRRSTAGSASSGEAIYGERVGEIAAELAMHFEQGRDAPRAVKYLLQAAENAMHRSAHHEADALARRGCSARHAPAVRRTRRQELSLR